LILPVVICLSQRLNHACLRISLQHGESANGSLKQLYPTLQSFIIRISALIVELIRAFMADFMESLYLLDFEPVPLGFLDDS